jgi:BRCA1-associated protein
VGIKVQKLQAKLDKCMEETGFLNDIHENLVKNMEMWRERIQKVKEREQAAIRLKDEKIEKLEEELSMFRNCCFLASFMLLFS